MRIPTARKFYHRLIKWLKGNPSQYTSRIYLYIRRHKSTIGVYLNTTKQNTKPSSKCSGSYRKENSRHLPPSSNCKNDSWAFEEKGSIRIHDLLDISEIWTHENSLWSSLIIMFYTCTSLLSVILLFLQNYSIENQLLFEAKTISVSFWDEDLFWKKQKLFSLIEKDIDINMHFTVSVHKTV